MGSPGIVRDDVGDLLLAADVARMSHHPAQAVDPLRRAVGSHRSDPRAPLAAFTLGRVLLDELGRPREAADAFADARALAPGGPLAEDALAREVEAASRAGDASRANARAQLYVTTYPSGARIRSVRRYGGLE
jgi:transmembrane sensor